MPIKPQVLKLHRAQHGSHFRAFGLRGVAEWIDPFLGVDHAWMSGPTFPPHPHAGFSAVSYLFLDSETGITNRDSIGNHNLIEPGGLHWATAGSGIVHEEVPAETGKTVHSLQIFVNLAPALRDMAPGSLSLAPQDIPVVTREGVKVRVPLGQFADVRSPLNPPTNVTVLDISLDEGAELILPIEAGHSAFIMPIVGAVQVDGQLFELNALELPVYAEQNTAHSITVRAVQGSAQIMLFSGQPIHPA